MMRCNARCGKEHRLTMRHTMCLAQSQVKFNNAKWRVFKLLSRCAHKSVRRRVIPPPLRPRPPLAINRSQRVGLINRAINYCISRHNNEVSSFRKTYGHHVGGRAISPPLMWCTNAFKRFFWML